MDQIGTFTTTGGLARLLGCSPQAIRLAEANGRIQPPACRLASTTGPHWRLYTATEAAAIAAVITGGRQRLLPSTLKATDLMDSEGNPLDEPPDTYWHSPRLDPGPAA